MPIPIIIGIAQFKEPPDGAGHDPATLAAQAARLALADTGAADAVQAAITDLHVVNFFTWRYEDAAGEVARHLGIKPPRSEYTPIGGDTPARLLDEACTRIAQEAGRVELVTGAEAMATAVAAQRSGQKPAGWPDPAPRPKVQYVPDYVLAHGLTAPIQMYPLYENAYRAAHGQSAAENNRESAELYAAFSEVAATHEAAWNTTPQTAEQIGTPDERNRLICEPYPLLMNALMRVNQGAAFIVTDTETATRLGVPPEQWVYVWSGAASRDSQDVLERGSYSRSPAAEATLDAALQGAGLRVDQIDLFDLYSCFPVVPKMAARHLGLPLGAGLTQTGGLTAFGGPGNNYTTHSIVNVADKLRSGEGQTGLVYGQGEFVTKHAAAVLARTAPPAERPYAPNPLPKLLPTDFPAIHHAPSGPASIETYTVEYSRTGQPARGFVIGRLLEGDAAGQRFLANVESGDLPTLQHLTDRSQEPIGQRGFVAAGNSQRHVFSFDEAYATGWVDTGQAEVGAQRRGDVLVVTLQRADAHNAISPEVTRGMNTVLDYAEREEGIRAVVLTGAGHQTFSAGADLKAMALGQAREIADPVTGFAGLTRRHLSKPLIAAVNGQALGGGFEIALACDLVVAADHAEFGLPEVRRGLIAAAGGLIHLARRIPRAVALELVMTGNSITAQRALELGLVNLVVPGAEVLPVALELAAQITGNGPLAVQLSKALVVAAPDLSEAEAWEQNTQFIRQVMASEDMQEGMRAFAGKRKPVWKGR